MRFMALFSQKRQEGQIITAFSAAHELDTVHMNHLDMDIDRQIFTCFDLSIKFSCKNGH